MPQKELRKRAMKINKYFAKSGICTIYISFVLFILSFLFGILPWLFALVFLFFTLIYLKRLRVNFYTQPLAIYAPISGRVKSIEMCEFKGQKSIRLIIKKGLFSGSVIAPFRAKFNELKKRHGLFLCPCIKTAGILSERALFVFSKDGEILGIRMVAGALALNMQTSEPKNDKYSTDVAVATELGFMVNGDVELLLPASACLSLSVGERVKKSALIGYLRS